MFEVTYDPTKAKPADLEAVIEKQRFGQSLAAPVAVIAQAKDLTVQARPKSSSASAGSKGTLTIGLLPKKGHALKHVEAVIDDKGVEEAKKELGALDKKAVFDLPLAPKKDAKKGARTVRVVIRFTAPDGKSYEMHVEVPIVIE